MKLLFGDAKGQTQDGKEVCRLLKEYKEKLNHNFSTEPLNFTDQELIKMLTYCIDNNVKLNTLIPWINEYKEDEDY